MKQKNCNHFWQGDWIDDQTLQKRVADLPSFVVGALKNPLKIDAVISAAQKVAELVTLPSEFKSSLIRTLIDGGIPESEDFEKAFLEVAEVLNGKNLQKKIKREFGHRNPFTISRIAYDDGLFEGRVPLGLLVHISPQNSFATGPLSVLEGLLAGNINFLKTGGSESLFAQKFLDGLIQADLTGTLKDFIIVGRISSKQKELLKTLFETCDGVAAWGGEESIQSIHEMCPPHVRVVEWGHRISFGYVTRDFFDDLEIQENIAKECCSLEQQACSSPQCLYLDTDNWEEVKKFARRFAPVLDRISKTIPRFQPKGNDMAEITQVTRCHQLEASFGKAETIEEKNGEWRILIDARESLLASPLYRTIWIKPLPRENICHVLRPMRQYLQTVGLSCALWDLATLSQQFFSAGATRVRRFGEMLGAYAGEPHDGVYALQRYTRKISIQTSVETAGISTFDELKNMAPLKFKSVPVTPKEAFEATESNAELFFKSGGTSGEPKMSTFSYEQYDEHMWLGAEGLYAAGLDPLSDRAINLFYSGNLYGGFISIFSALERLNVKQFPMTAVSDYKMVAETIIKNKINVVMGMPSYLLQLFKDQADVLKKYRGVKKIFFGGEHFTEPQRKYLTDEFDIEIIRSGAYGSVDIGPMGYQCAHCGEGEHHLQQSLLSLEILKLDEDTAVKDGEVGRLVFSPHQVGSGKPNRYAIGDVGRWIDDPGGRCVCGRGAPRFKLLGRTGDIFRIATFFLNFQKFQMILSGAGYAGEFQIGLSEEGLAEKLELRVTEDSKISQKEIHKLCLSQYAELEEAVLKDKVLVFEVRAVKNQDFEKSRGSGKLLRVIDTRKAGRL